MTYIPFNQTLWQAVPYSVYTSSQNRMQSTVPKKDLVLVNNDLLKQGISEMTASVNRLSAIDQNGIAHEISSFKAQTVNLKDLNTGLYMRTKEMLNLNAGHYTALRWHFDSAHHVNFVLSNKSETAKHDLEYLDFDIENGLIVEADEVYNLTLRFKFVPLESTNYLDLFKDFIKKQGSFTKQMVRGFGSF